MSANRPRWRVGSEWLVTSSEVDPNWFKPPSNTQLPDEARRAISDAVRSINAMLPSPTDEPVQLSDAYLREELGLGDGWVPAIGEADHGLNSLLCVPGQEFSIDTDALCVLRDEAEALSNKYLYAARLARVQAHLMGLQSPFDELGSLWDAPLLQQLDRMYSELHDLYEPSGDAGRAQFVAWLQGIVTQGLRSQTGQQVLLAVQACGVQPDEMDELSLDEANALAKIWARVRLERDVRE